MEIDFIIGRKEVIKQDTFFDRQQKESEIGNIIW